MDDALREQIRMNLNLRDTEDLFGIWEKRDVGEWDEEVFKIIEGILIKRLGYRPLESIQVQVTQILTRANKFWQAGNLAQALVECEFAIKLAPNLAIAYNYRGLIYDEMELFEEAVADYQTAIRLDPDLKNAWDNLMSVEKDIEKQFLQSPAKQHLDQALEYTYSEEPEKALEECELAKETLPRIAVAYNYLGMIYEGLEQFEPAINAYLDATRFNPRFYAAQRNLVNVRFRLEEELNRQVAKEDKERKHKEEEITPDFNETLEFDIDWPDDPVPGWVYLDEKAFILAGWPGNRTRSGRSGYDYLDNQFELAHIIGVVIRLLIIRKFRTHNPLYLLLMTWFGFTFSFPLLFSGIAIIQGDLISVVFIVLLSPYWIVGIALLINVLLSLGIKKPDEYEYSGNEFF